MLKQKKRQDALCPNKTRSQLEVAEKQIPKKLDSTNEPKQLVKHLLEVISALEDEMRKQSPAEQEKELELIENLHLYIESL